MGRYRTSRVPEEKVALHRQGLKRCSGCRRVKRHAEFQTNRSRWDGLQCHCRVCVKLRYGSRSSQESREGKVAAYGLTWEEYCALYAKQDGRCAICRVPIRMHRASKGDPDKWGAKTARIDHDHETKKVRGLLCHNCNAGIGHLRDDPTIVRRALLYLQDGR